LALPIGPIACAPLVTVSEDDFVYRAIGRIERHRIRHLGVVDASGRLVGAVTTRNLLRHRATTAIVLGDEIDTAASSAALAAAWAKLVPMGRSLTAEDVDPRQTAAVISTEVCAITARAAALAEARMATEGLGPPPVPYAVLVLGSAGRGESLLAADQDNAIVFREGQPGGPADRWFETLGRHMTATLDEAGVPLCKGGVMARNAEWRRNVAGWHATIDGWIRRQRPADLLNTDIFFDAVPVHGDLSLGEEIIAAAWTRAHASAPFVKLLSELAREGRAPFTLLGNIRTDQDGRVDLKRAGLMPIFTGARVLALRHGLRRRSTPERLTALAERGAASPAEVERVIAAHRVLLGALLGQQLVDAERGVPLSPRIELQRLDRAGRDSLKEALHSVATITDMVGEGRF
jgi:DNA polymerase-3 subunit epsilon/CBS domain-containing protein